MSSPSTRRKLLSIIEDVEIFTKELLELVCTPKGPKDSNEAGSDQLVDFLIQKERELQEGLKCANEQAELQKRLDALRIEVERRDQDIMQLQKSLKEGETMLSSAIYQAKQKLEAIGQANKRQISSEELIKYAHKISSSNAVSAPPGWAPGDPRRPYPTDLEMRCGWLGRQNEMHNQSPFQSANSLSDLLSTSSRSGSQTQLHNSDHQIQQSSHNVSWQQQNVDTLHHSGGFMTQNPHLDSKLYPNHSHQQQASRDNEVEEMNSSDSSSSSSSDE